MGDIVATFIDSAVRSAPAARVIPPFAPDQEASGDGGDPSSRDVRDHASGYSAFIRYIDAGGAVSQRRITVRAVHPGERQIHAWCHERLGPRIFRIDRIQFIARCETGEIVEVEDWLQELSVAGVKTADGRLDQMVKVLSFLMHCDGSAHQFERDAMEAALIGFAMRFDGNDEWVTSGLRVAQRLAPDSRDFHSALHWMARCDERAALARFLLPHAARLIEADGVIHANEVVFGHELDVLLKRLIDGQPRFRRG